MTEGGGNFIAAARITREPMASKERTLPRFCGLNFVSGGGPGAWLDGPGRAQDPNNNTKRTNPRLLVDISWLLAEGFEPPMWAKRPYGWLGRSVCRRPASSRAQPRVTSCRRRF